jgi:hypothetical protein
VYCLIELPQEVTTVLATSETATAASTPQLHEIVNILKRNNLEVSAKSINVSEWIDIYLSTLTTTFSQGNEKDVLAFLKSQNGPTIVLHQKNVQLPLAVNTLGSSSNNTVTPLTEAQISQYQVCHLLCTSTFEDHFGFLMRRFAYGLELHLYY